MNRCIKSLFSFVPEMLLFDPRCLQHFTTHAVVG